jgi:hypothetical protein
MAAPGVLSPVVRRSASTAAPATSRLSSSAAMWAIHVGSVGGEEAISSAATPAPAARTRPARIRHRPLMRAALASPHCARDPMDPHHG